MEHSSTLAPTDDQNEVLSAPPQAETPSISESSEVHSQVQKPEQRPAKQREPSAEVKKLLEEVGTMPTAEKAAPLVAFLQAVLAKQPPQLHDFWDARKALVALVQEMGEAVPAELATQLHDLSAQARTLRDQLDAAAAEAQAALEELLARIELDTAHIEEAIRARPPLEEVPEPLQAHREFYVVRQQKAVVLHELSLRLTQLRKQILESHLRPRHKNALLARLSKAGDVVYPARKEVSTELAERFEADVNTYLAGAFEETAFRHLNTVRDAIKGLQGIAKGLYLPPVAFNRMRGVLSQSWERLKGLETERRKERQVKVQEAQVATASIEAKIQAMEAALPQALEGQAEAKSALAEAKSAAFTLLRTAPLRKAEAQALRERILKVEGSLDDHHAQQRKERKQASERREEEYRDKVLRWEQAVEALRGQGLAPADLREPCSTLREEIKQAGLLRVDQDRLGRLLGALEDEWLISAAETAEDAALPQLRDQLKKRRQELKRSVDELRRDRGGAGLSLAKGLETEQSMHAEKERLDRIVTLQYEVEKRLFELQR